MPPTGHHGGSCVGVASGPRGNVHDDVLIIIQHPGYCVAVDHGSVLVAICADALGCRVEYVGRRRLLEVKQLVVNALLGTRAVDWAGVKILVDGDLGAAQARRAHDPGLLLAMPIEVSGAATFKLEVGDGMLCHHARLRASVFAHDRDARCLVLGRGLALDRVREWPQSAAAQWVLWFRGWPHNLAGTGDTLSRRRTRRGRCAGRDLRHVCKDNQRLPGRASEHGPGLTLRVGVPPGVVTVPHSRRAS